MHAFCRLAFTGRFSSRMATVEMDPRRPRSLPQSFFIVPPFPLIPHLRLPLLQIPRPLSLIHIPLVPHKQKRPALHLPLLPISIRNPDTALHGPIRARFVVFKLLCVFARADVVQFAVDGGGGSRDSGGWRCSGSGQSRGSSGGSNVGRSTSIEADGGTSNLERRGFCLGSSVLPEKRGIRPPQLQLVPVDLCGD